VGRKKEPVVKDIYQGRSFSALKTSADDSFRDRSVVTLYATRGMVPIEAAIAWMRISYPMNEKRSFIHRKKQEVASAYNWMVEACINPKSTVTSYKYLLTLEEDNIPPHDGLLKLFQTISTCPDCQKPVGLRYNEADDSFVEDGPWECPDGHRGFDGVGGLYFTKAEPSFPMAFGNPKKEGDWRPRSVSRAVESGSVLEVNGIAQGFSLFRADLFRGVSKPWFKTISRGDDSKSFTQDLWFCRKAKEEAGARFGVDCSVKVGHIDPATGVIW
jgi:hypothetical protein